MARRRPTDGYARLLVAAERVFSRRGLALAKMSEIAKEMGVSNGTLYGYVESKQALFGLLVSQGGSSGEVTLPDVLPVPTPEPAALRKAFEQSAARFVEFPVLRGASVLEAAANPAEELELIIGELWTVARASRHWVDLIEASAWDVPWVAEAFVIHARRPTLSAVEAYVASRMKAGQFKDAVSAPLVARFIVETVGQFARRFARDPDPETKPDASEDELLECTIQLVCSAVLHA